MFIPSLYRLLHLGHGPEGSDLYLPSTVVFSHGVPQAWYFTSQKHEDHS
eukprot:g13077.t1